MKTLRNNNKLNGLQALRGLAFIGIFLGHTGLGFTQLSSSMVSIFIIMSGFLLVLNNYEKELPCNFLSNLKYSIGKIKRLYPLHVLTTLLLFLLFFYFSLSNAETFGSPSGLVFKAILNLTLLQSFVPIDSYCISLNGVSWYLSTCAFLYFVFPLILKHMRKNYSVKKACVFSGIAYLLMIAIAYLTRGLVFAGEDFHDYITYICPFYRVLDFFIGCNLGYLYLNCRKETSKGKMTVLETVTVLVIILSWVICNATLYTALSCVFVEAVLWLPAALLLVWIFADNSGFFCSFISSSPLVELGYLSNYAFLIHYVILVYFSSLLRFLFNGFKNDYLSAFISLILTIVASLLYRAYVSRKSA